MQPFEVWNLVAPVMLTTLAVLDFGEGVGVLHMDYCGN